MNLVLDAVDAGHQHGRERQVRVARRIREPHLHPIRHRIAALHIGDADGSGSIARRIGQQHRRLEARHQPLVGIGGGVGKGVDGAGVLDDAADVVERRLGEAGVAIAVERVLAVAGDGLMHMHPVAVVSHQGLGHERGRLAVGMRDVVDAVLVDLHLVRLRHQRVEPRPDFVLAGRAHFVVMHLHRDAHGLHGAAHGAAQIRRGIHRRHREVTAFHARAVAQVAPLELGVGFPSRLLRGDGVRGAGDVHLPAHVVEDEELRLGPEIGRVADARGGQVLLGELGGGARIAAVRLHGARLHDVATQVDGGFVAEGIQHRGRVVWQQDHVGLVDGLPTRNGRAIEHEAVGEHVFVHALGRHGGVLLLAPWVGEPQVHPLGVLVLNQLQCVFRHSANAPCEFVV